MIKYAEFTRWEGGVANIGCIGSSCSNEYALTAAGIFDESQGKLIIYWNAMNKDNKMPYICQSKCPRYYQWFPSIKKCVGTFHSTDAKTYTLGEATLQCSLQNGRLLSSNNCNDTINLINEVNQTFAMPGQTYFVGTFSFHKANGAIYRNWNDLTVYNS